MELASNPSPFMFFGPLWNYLQILKLKSAVITKSNHLLKCTLLVHLRKQNVQLC